MREIEFFVTTVTETNISMEAACLFNTDELFSLR